MARSSQLRSTTLLLMAMGTLLSPASSWSGSDGPGDWTTYKDNKSYYKGGPKPGYHVATADPSKKWNDQVTLVNTDGTPGETVQNQRIVADAPKDTPAVAKDPCDGMNSEDGAKGYYYDSTSEQYLVKDGQPNAGFPKTPLPATVTNALRRLNYVDGLPLTKSGADTSLEGYNTLSKAQYTLLYCGAGWCGVCDAFSPQFAAYYEAQRKSNPNKFDVVFLSMDQATLNSQTGKEENTAEEAFKANYAKMPFKAPAKFDADLAIKVQDIANVTSIPAVIVVDNKTGEVVTTKGVEGMQGKEVPATEGAYPLPAAPELFKKTDDKPCPTDVSAERAALIAQANKEVDDMGYDDMPALKALADDLQHQFGGVVPQDYAGLKAYIKAKNLEKLNGAKDADIRKLYAKMQEDRDAAEAARMAAYRKFKVGTQIKPLRDFTSDNSPTGMIRSQSIPALYGNSPNIGSILSVDMGEDGVPKGLTAFFSDATAYQRYILRANFDNIESLSA